MAGFAQAATPTRDNIPPVAPVTRAHPSSTRSLPNGPCNYRDLAFGSCGCNQFWDKCSADVHDGSNEHRTSNERSTWCVCGHHACFHLHNTRVDDTSRWAVVGGQPLANAAHNGQRLSPAVSQREYSEGTRSAGRLTPAVEALHAATNGRLNTSHPTTSDHSARPQTSHVKRLAAAEQYRTPSEMSMSGLPRVPSVCFLSHERHERNAANSIHGRQISNGDRPAQHAGTGLGLSMLSPGTVEQASDRPKTAPGATGNFDYTSRNSFIEPLVSSSTRANSLVDPNEHVFSPLGPLEQLAAYNRTSQTGADGQPLIDLPSQQRPTESDCPIPTEHLPDFRPMLPELNVCGDTIPDTYNPDEFINSATEVATPSNANTPDLAVADQAVHESKRVVDILTKLTAGGEGQQAASENRPNGSTPTLATPLILPQSPLHEQLQLALRSGSPQALHRLVNYLTPLHNLLNSMPNVANTMREMTTRLDHLENSSFNHLQPEDFHNTMEFYDGRILELEHRLDDHDKVHQAIDADQGSGSLTRRHITSATASFGSNQSLQSTTSSALILAAMDRKDLENELGDIKDRLDVLEASAPPTVNNSWEIEVVLLPWGPELRGIWFPSDEPMHDNSNAITQNSEEWTQALDSKIINRSMSLQGDERSMRHSGNQTDARKSFAHDHAWDADAITEWASGPSDEWLFPKACGSKNLVYKRLQSRGFVKTITLTSASSRDIQAQLTTAFQDLVEHLEYDGQDNLTVSSHPGLLASFIPLRKVIKESRLRFLAPSEMTTSALWSAQFLASGVLMRVSGGKRRLYVTQREAYMQDGDYDGVSWTWQQLRQLPRYQPDMDSQMEGNDEHCQPRVEEADAKEACWAYVEAYDQAPMSAENSFSSHHSAPAQLSLRPADKPWRRSITPTSILKNRNPHPQHPLSPLSEKHPIRPGQGRARTASTSAIDHASLGPSKRRLNSSPVKQSSAPQPGSRMSSSSVLRPKRRRVTHSSSSPPDRSAENPHTNQVVLFNDNPRRSRELPSPFYSSHPELPRTNSDVTNRSQRSVPVVSKGTPFAYATPYSGPISGGRPNLGGFGDEAGDTEPDENYDSGSSDDDDDSNDDDDISWDGVGDDQSHFLTSSPSDMESNTHGGAVMEQPTSFSGDDSGFGSEGHEDDSDSDNNGDGNAPGDDTGYTFGAQPQTDDGEEDGEDEEDVFDTLLNVLER